MVTSSGACGVVTPRHPRRKPKNCLDTLATARLLGEAISAKHFPEVRSLHSDLKVMKTISSDGNVLSEETTREHLRQNADHWKEHGFGLWVFRRKSDGRFVGRGGLKLYEIEGENVVGLAYAVLSDYWNQGFATEMAEASLRIGFETFDFPEIVLWTLPTNLAAQRVTEKFGFRYIRYGEFAGLWHVFYRLSALEWKGA
jgi:ribosomal-protein-alanine N-acetyltransferase